MLSRFGHHHYCRNAASLILIHRKSLHEAVPVCYVAIQAKFTPSRFPAHGCRTLAQRRIAEFVQFAKLAVVVLISSFASQEKW
jgi:hypothetical protein